MYYDAYEKPELEDIEHYGVLGMKWGVRKNPAKAIRKASKKLYKLDRKASRKQRKADKQAYKAEKKMMKSETAWTAEGSAKNYKKSRKLSVKARKSQFKATKASNRAKKWANKMEKYLSGTKVKDIEGLKPEYVRTGKSYALDMMKWGPEYYKRLYGSRNYYKRH